MPRWTIPENVPPDLVVDFDCFAPANMGSDVQLAWGELQNGPDIVWTPHNGGHWIATRAADIELMQVDYEHFSHRQFNLPPNPADIVLIPLSLDPPEHGKFRKLLTPAFEAKAIEAMEATVRESARDLINVLAPRGACEFVTEFAQILPINAFLTMVDLPLTDREMLLHWAEVAPRTADLEEKKAVHRQMNEYLNHHIGERMQAPRDDVLSMIVQSEVDGRRVTLAEARNLCTLLLFGGLDTVVSQMGFIAKFLAESPEHRRALLEQPSIMHIAVEELIRRFSLPNTARILTKDYLYKGVQFRKGDMIQLPKCLYGLDDRRNSAPRTVDFHRNPSTIRHAGFGGGPHACPGAGLARRELIVFLQEWLPRIPDFQVDAEKPLRMAAGIVNAVLELHLHWRPASSI